VRPSIRPPAKTNWLTNACGTATAVNSLDEAQNSGSTEYPRRKATLVLAMLCERMAPKLEKPTVLTAEQSLRFRVRSLIDAFNGPFGKIVAGLIAEGQSEPAVLHEFFDRWVS